MSHSLLNEKISKFKGQFKEHTHMPTIKNVECVYKHAYFMMLLVCGILKIYTNELICKTGTDLQTGENKFVIMECDGGRVRGLVGEFGIDMYTLMYLKWSSKDLPHSTENSGQCYVTASVEKEFEKRIYIYTHTYIHVCVCINYIYIYITESLFCTHESNTAL